MTLTTILMIILYYLIGSIPWGLIIGKIKHVDIRTKGSGNMGSTNAIRVLGKKMGLLVFLLDVLKGLVPMLVALTLSAKGLINLSFSPYYLGICLCLGHCYPIFAGFKGGKAVATSLGILITVSPLISAFVVLVVFAITTLTTKIVALGSTAAFIAAVLLIFIFDYSTPVKILGIVLLILIVYKHMPNYKRILNHTENKIKSKSSK